MNGSKGIAASGHEKTSQAATRVLESGGNAFDAALAAMCVSFIAEPMLSSPGGGGFLMAQPSSDAARIYDFFVQTPGQKRPEAELDFYPILADFGTATQEFHIGMGSIAVPGAVAGLFAVHSDLGRIPLREIVAPAIELARDGVPINDFQNYIARILEPILLADPDAMRIVASASDPGVIAPEGSLVTNPDLANALDALVSEGPGLFYLGELANRFAEDCREKGGMISAKDMAAYEVIVREPVLFESHGASFAFNAPPSPSGCLVAFALGMLEPRELSARRWGHAGHCMALADAMRVARDLRRQSGLDSSATEQQVREILGDDSLEQWRESMKKHPSFSRGTTHISVADSDGNLAALTISNGEGSSYVLPGTGIMLNNMLGEEDLNPGGFHQWAEGARMASMMCPSVATLPDGARVALGSGGSNRIRSAILQVLINLFEFNLPLAEAVSSPRIHLEHDHLSFETGFGRDAIDELTAHWPSHQEWPEPNMFFGGVHAVERLSDGQFRGAGDPRRGGSVATAG